jgi:hypothetical protein
MTRAIQELNTFRRSCEKIRSSATDPATSTTPAHHAPVRRITTVGLYDIRRARVHRASSGMVTEKRTRTCGMKESDSEAGQKKGIHQNFHIHCHQKDVMNRVINQCIGWRSGCSYV